MTYFQFNERLNEFGVCAENDLISATGDGASVMVSFGNKAVFEYVTCLNHTINLAVLATIFPKEIDFGEASDESEADDFPERVFHVDETFSSTVAKMKAIINCFRKSPLKNNLLQAELEKQNRKKLELILFTRTRWNSLVISGQRFLELLPAVSAVLMELGNSLPWETQNTDLLKVS